MYSVHVWWLGFSKANLVAVIKRWLKVERFTGAVVTNTCDNPPQSSHPTFLPAPIPFLPWLRSNHVRNINMLSPMRVQRFFRLTNHHVRTRRVRLTITRAVIFQSRLMIPSATIVIVSSASLGIDNVSYFFDITYPSFLDGATSQQFGLWKTLSQ
jgi:hypothetical protein